MKVNVSYINFHQLHNGANAVYFHASGAAMALGAYFLANSQLTCLIGRLASVFVEAIPACT